MSRNPSATDFTVPVEGIGAFSFAKRTMRDQFRISSEHARLTEGVNPVPADLDLMAASVSTLTVLTVKAPDGWDMATLDPLEEETFEKILKVYGALRAAEEKFRRGDKNNGEAAGAGEGKNA